MNKHIKKNIILGHKLDKELTQFYRHVDLFFAVQFLNCRSDHNAFLKIHHIYFRIIEK